MRDGVVQIQMEGRKEKWRVECKVESVLYGFRSRFKMSETQLAS